MDLIRASIKALFYDYTPDLVAKYILGADHDKEILETFPNMAAWREQNFTLSEMAELLNVLKNCWLNKSEYSATPFISKLLLLPIEFTNQVLKIQDNETYPTIIFENLLRWRELSYYVGEDMLTCSYLAKVDSNERTHFVWETHLPHDDAEINSFIADGLTDIHHHLWGSTDVAEFNWIRLMNNPKAWNKNKGSSIDKNTISKDLILLADKEQRSLFHWIVVACAIRIRLFKWLKGQQIDFDTNDVDELMQAEESRVINWVNQTCKNEIDCFRRQILKTRIGELSWDYAILDIFPIEYEDKKSPYMLHYGERKYMYSMFRRFYQSRNREEDKTVRKYSKYFYLYLIIKAHIRKQLVHTNPLKGLRNFMEYMIEQKRCFPSDINDGVYDNVLYNYVVQTAVGNNGQYELENRFDTVVENRLLDIDYSLSIFSEGQSRSENVRVTAVASLSKNLFKGNTEKTMERLSILLNQYHHPERYKVVVVGVDFTGMELNVRPEKIAPFIRWLRNKGLSNFTYHVGEDYLDLIDGLRSIDELVRFAEYREGDRLGHATALVVNPHEYYESRHYNVIASKLCILDNIVWLCKNVSELDESEENTLKDLKKCATRFFTDCGFKGEFVLDTYWNSILLRGDYQSENIGLGDWVKACSYQGADEARMDVQAKVWNDWYRKVDRSSIPFQWSKQIVPLVTKCQAQLRAKLSKYHIEVCPSSNMRIGGFKRYDRLPILRDYHVDGQEPVFSLSINTDDRGIFSTSLPMEYSLLAIALLKSGKSKESVTTILQQIKEESHNHRFQRN